MVELGSRRTTERVRVGNSPPTAARAVFLPDVNDLSTVRVSTHVYNNPAEVDLVLDEVRRTASA